MWALILIAGQCRSRSRFERSFDFPMTKTDSASLCQYRQPKAASGSLPRKFRFRTAAQAFRLLFTMKNSHLNASDGYSPSLPSMLFRGHRRIAFDDAAAGGRRLRQYQGTPISASSPSCAVRMSKPPLSILSSLFESDFAAYFNSVLSTAH